MTFTILSPNSIMEVWVAMAGGLAGLENFDSPMDMAETSSTFGVKLTPLKDYVRTQFADSEH